MEPKIYYRLWDKDSRSASRNKNRDMDGGAHCHYNKGELYDQTAAALHRPSHPGKYADSILSVIGSRPAMRLSREPPRSDQQHRPGRKFASSC
jgi:hypothetical protein